MQGVHRAPVDGATGGDQGLAGDLAAEDPLAILLGAVAAKQVHLELLEVEGGEHLIDGFHGDLSEPSCRPGRARA